MFNRTFVGMLAVAVALCARVEAFVMIDTAGPREIISPMSFEEAKDRSEQKNANNDPTMLHSQAVKLSTKDKALTAYVLAHAWKATPEKPEPGVFPQYDVYTLGATLKLSATNGVEDFFKFERWPSTELGALFNWTSYPGGRGAPGPIVSLTVQGGAEATDLVYIPKTGNPTMKKVTERNVDGFGTVTAGIYWRNVPIVEQAALVLSAEVRRETNFDELPKITTAELTPLAPPATGSPNRVILEKSTVARWGDLERATTIPVTLAAVLTHRADWIGRLFAEGNMETRFYWSPYFRLKTASGAGTSRAGGLNLAVRNKTQPKEGGPKITYPLSLFVERGTDFGQREWKTTVGASTVFSWGP